MQILGLQAIWVPAGSSSALENALASPSSPAATSYTPALAVQWVWDEGRNPTITAARVGAPLRAILGKFVSQFSAHQLAMLVATGKNVTDLAVSQPKLLSTPIDITETNLFPAASVVAIGGLATTIGLILVSVFALAGVNFIVGLPLQSTSPGGPGVSFWGAALVQCGAVFAIGCTIAAAYATIVAGMAGLSGTQWAQLWAVMWLLFLVRSNYLFLGFECSACFSDAYCTFSRPCRTSRTSFSWSASPSPQSSFRCLSFSCLCLIVRFLYRPHCLAIAP